MKDLIIALIGLLVLFAGTLTILRLLRSRYESDETRLEAIDAAKELCEKLLEQVAFALFTQAERQFGGGTGKLKFSAVMSQFLAMLPDWAKEAIDTDWLAAKLEILLLEAKKLWAKNNKLINDNN